MSDWKEKCSECKHLIRSGHDGNVWHCAAVRVGRNNVYAVTARLGHNAKCGLEARLFEPSTVNVGGEE